MRNYYSYTEDEAYRDGRRDAEYGRRNYDYDEHFGGDIDRAYYEGLRDQEREEDRRREYLEQERREEERQVRMEEERRQYLRDLEEQEYYYQMQHRDHEE